MINLYYLKTNYIFLIILFIVLTILLFFLLRWLYPDKFNRNVPITVIVSLIIVLGIYYIPIKIPRMSGNFDDKLLMTNNDVNTKF